MRVSYYISSSCYFRWNIHKFWCRGQTVQWPFGILDGNKICRGPKNMFEFSGPSKGIAQKLQRRRWQAKFRVPHIRADNFYWWLHSWGLLLSVELHGGAPCGLSTLGRMGNTFHCQGKVGHGVDSRKIYIGIAKLSLVWYVIMCVSHSCLCNQLGANL